MPRTVRNIVEDALSPKRSDTLWTANYSPALPFTPQEFDIDALLPAMLYMFRRGHRRGKGKFIETFGQKINGKISAPTIFDVAKHLSTSDLAISGFDDETGQAILGDLLLTYCLENTNKKSDHHAKIQRVFPTHYFASWLDLPKEVINLRGVPELLVTLLAQQEKGEWLESNYEEGCFNVGVDFSHNELLTLLGRYTTIDGRFSDLNSDALIETEATDIGIDELLTIRTAQACSHAPLKIRGGREGEKISNQKPLAHRAAQYLYEDLSLFIKTYGTVIPRQAFLQMLGAGISLGLTNLLLSTANLLVDWEQSGQVAEFKKQNPLPLFVDCSHGQDKELRNLSEGLTAECIRRYERLPLLMMLLRVLDDRVRLDRKLRDSLPTSSPDATEWINLLGEIYKEKHPRSEAILDNLDQDCQHLADALEKEKEISEPEVAHRLRQNKSNPALALAEALIELMDDRLQGRKYLGTLDSTLMVNQPNGLAFKRRVDRSQAGNRRRVDLRAIVLTTPMLEFLVHCHLIQKNKDKNSARLSLQDFIKLLRDRYGLYIAQEPPGQPIAQETLLRNKDFLERRLRDLGLLIGVNDAESMKQFKPHYIMEMNNAAS